MENLKSVLEKEIRGIEEKRYQKRVSTITKTLDALLRIAEKREDFESELLHIYNSYSDTSPSSKEIYYLIGTNYPEQLPSYSLQIKYVGIDTSSYQWTEADKRSYILFRMEFPLPQKWISKIEETCIGPLLGLPKEAREAIMEISESGVEHWKPKIIRYFDGKRD